MWDCVFNIIIKLRKIDRIRILRSDNKMISYLIFDEIIALKMCLFFDVFIFMFLITIWDIFNCCLSFESLFICHNKMSLLK